MVTTRNPAIKTPITDVEALIDHLKPMLEKHLANDVTNIYYGDIGVYLPSSFIGARKENKAVLALSPAYDRLVDKSRVAGQENRVLGIDIIGLVNITPYFTASPKEAYGERQLSDLMKKIRTFLTQEKNVNLDGRVQYLDVGDITWAWMKRDKLDLRGAALSIEATIRVNRRA